MLSQFYFKSFFVALCLSLTLSTAAHSQAVLGYEGIFSGHITSSNFGSVNVNDNVSGNIHFFYNWTLADSNSQGSLQGDFNIHVNGLHWIGHQFPGFINPNGSSLNLSSDADIDNATGPLFTGLNGDMLLTITSPDSAIPTELNPYPTGTTFLGNGRMFVFQQYDVNFQVDSFSFIPFVPEPYAIIFAIPIAMMLMRKRIYVA